MCYRTPRHIVEADKLTNHANLNTLHQQNKNQSFQCHSEHPDMFHYLFIQCIINQSLNQATKGFV